MQQATAPSASKGLVLFQTQAAAPHQPSVVNVAAAGQDDTSVKKGDTLISVVQQAAAAQGKTVSNAQAWQMAKHLAVSNGIDNPNLIHPGQRLRMNSLGGLMAALPTSGVFASAAGKASGQVISTQAALALRMTTALSASSLNILQRSNESAGGSNRLFVGHALHPRFFTAVFSNDEFRFGDFVHQVGLTDGENVLDRPVEREGRGVVVAEEEEHQRHEHHDPLLHFIAGFRHHRHLDHTGRGHDDGENVDWEAGNGK